MKLTDLIANLKAHDAKIDALLTNPTLSAEQQADHDRLVAERPGIKASIDREKSRISREQERADLDREATLNADRERRTMPAPGRRSDPDMPTPNNPAPVASVPAQPRAHDPNRGFKHPRDFLMSVMKFGQGEGMDRRLEPLVPPRHATVGSDEARGNSDPAGKFLVPEGFSPNLMQLDPEADPIGALTTKIPMSNPMVRMPARLDKNHSTSVSGGLTWTRRPETVAGTASQMTFEQVALVAHELFGLSYASETILTDSPISFIAILNAGFSQQLVAHLINERLNGTGVGEFLGIMNSPCLVSVAKESGQEANTIRKENIDNMRSRCWNYGSSVWLYNHDCLPQLRSLVQVVGTGGVVVPYFSVDANGNSTLDGRPAFATEYTKTLGTSGDLVLGVWGEFLEGTYQPMEMAESIHVRFVNHERAFKFWLRNAGEPWWKSALTPKNSSRTLSPFVVLDTRA